MPNRDLVVIGASAGGVEALQQICTALPSDLDAALLIVMHISASSDSLLPRVLRRAGCLNAINPSDAESIQRRMIYGAPPDRHMIVEGHHLRLIRGRGKTIIVQRLTLRSAPPHSPTAHA